jgi:hypothetical protein
MHESATSSPRLYLGACLLHKFLTAIVIIHIYTTSTRRSLPPSASRVPVRVHRVPIVNFNTKIVHPIIFKYKIPPCPLGHMTIAIRSYTLSARLQYTALTSRPLRDWERARARERKRKRERERGRARVSERERESESDLGGRERERRSGSGRLFSA